MLKYPKARLEKKIIEYSDRHQFWTEQAINQFGISINLFFVLGVGILAHLTPQRSNFNVAICLQCNVHWTFLIYLLISSLTLLSVIFGAISVLSRLYDLRLTRHTLWTRKKAAENEILLGDQHIDISKIDFIKKLENLWSTLTCKDFFITDNDTSNKKKLKLKFKELKKRNILLGDLSWICHLWQVALLSGAVLLYTIVLLLNVF